MRNGIYPQFGAASGSSIASGGGPRFGGGLYPPGTNVASSRAPANPFNIFGGIIGRGNKGDFSPANVGEQGDSRGGAAELTYFERATEAFKEGNESLAVNLLYAYYLSDELGASEYELAWFDGLASPRLFSRFGIGVTYSPFRGFQEPPPTIGEPHIATGRRSGGNPEDMLGQANQGGGASGPGGRNVSKSPYANVDTSAPAGALLYYTGDFGERLYKRLNDRRKLKSMFGALLTKMPEPEQRNTVPKTTASTSAPQSPAGGAPSRRDNPFVLGNMGGGNPPPVVGGGSGPEADSSQNQAGTTISGTLVSKWSLTAPSGPPADDLVGTLLPGVVMLGQGNREQLLSRAREQGVDLLFIFDVVVPQPPRNGAPYALISLRLMDVTDPEKPINLKTTTQLNSQKVAELRSTQQNDRNDPVELELDKIFQQTVDVKYFAARWPEAINEDNVSRRVDDLTQDKNRNPWLSAVEIIGYVRAGLLRDSFAEEALEKLLGRESRVLISGSTRERKAFLEDTLIRSSLSPNTGDASGFR